MKTEKNYTILIIEDNKMNMEFIEEILFSDYNILKACDGLEGFQVILNEKPDLIICDIMMPKMNGLQVLQMLRDSKEFATIPFIFLTARSEKEDLRLGMESGADDYLTKPFTSKELMNAVHCRIKRKETVEAELQEKINKVKNDINSVSSHEFNTPLNGIIGFTDLLLLYFDKFPKEDLLKMLKNIKISTLRLQRVTSNIVSYGYLQKYLHTPETYPVIPTTESLGLIEKTALTIAEHFDRKNDLIIDLTEASVNINKDDLCKITEELISNAFKFSEKGTEVVLKSYIKPGFLYLEIHDKGYGMSSDEINAIAPYKQFNRNFKEQQGMGLGLYISKLLTEFNRGAFTIQSKPDEGTNICLYIPLYA